MPALVALHGRFRRLRGWLFDLSLGPQEDQKEAKRSHKGTKDERQGG